MAHINIYKEGLTVKKRNRRKLQRIRIGLVCLAVLVSGVLLGKGFNAEAAARINKATEDADIRAAKSALIDKSSSGKKGSDGRSIKGQDTKNDRWQLVLVNSAHPLTKGYVPALASVGNGYQFDKRAADSLNKMLADAKAARLSPLICSAYRTIQKQTDLYNNQVNKQMDKGLSYEKACSEAKKVVAYPGTSEHNLGLAVDIVAKSYQLLDDSQAETPETIWLTENCYKYGFILRYPSDKSDVTGIIFEPWHYRYVGVDAATYIMKNGICLEEYLSTYLNGN